MDLRVGVVVAAPLRTPDRRPMWAPPL